MLDRSRGLSANLKNDQAIIDEVLETLATPGDTGPVAKNQSNELSRLVPRRGKRRLAESTSSALGPVQQSASKIAAGGARSITFAKLMPNLHKATSGICPPGNHVVHFASHVARSVSKALAESKPNSRARRFAAAASCRLSDSECLCDRPAKSRSVLQGHRNRAGHEPDFASRTEFRRKFQQDGRHGRSRVEGCLPELEEIVKATKPTFGMWRRLVDLPSRDGDSLGSPKHRFRNDARLCRRDPRVALADLARRLHARSTGREFRAIAHRRLEDVSPRRRFGDLIYALPAIRALGGGALYLSEVFPAGSPVLSGELGGLLARKPLTIVSSNNTDLCRAARHAPDGQGKRGEGGVFDFSATTRKPPCSPPQSVTS